MKNKTNHPISSNSNTSVTANKTSKAILTNEQNYYDFGYFETSSVLAFYNIASFLRCNIDGKQKKKDNQ